jgi:hypothetical protein
MHRHHWIDLEKPKGRKRKCSVCGMTRRNLRVSR